MTRTLPAPPPRIARLPHNKAAYPVPWFVAWIDGAPDFRVIGAGKLDDAIRFRSCWLCGQPLGANAAFVLGPMCGITRTSPEPPSHRDCADYAARACPFLATPGMRRRETGIPDAAREPDGIMIRRNPGATLVWVSRNWCQQKPFQLWYVGDPIETRWYAEGREATRAEVLASIDSGLPLLRAEAERDPRPAAALAELDAQHRRAMTLLPAESTS
ncbi:hypothetical protein ACH40F_08200 [Streptomyces sp. NPDC020794]|uniref:hypothetical protein n=1 Tax=unclassified Streptomyces TaxID=2593676 RepID=UPI0036EEF773